MDGRWTRNSVLGVALIVRLILVGWSKVHDYMFEVKYTDIDYWVYHDAAVAVSNGGSPFERATYRYSPLLAWCLLPNTLSVYFGKLLFSVADILVAWMCMRITDGRLGVRSASENNDVALKWCCLFWLANPLTLIVSSRGNADSMVVGSVLCFLLLIQENRWVSAAVVHGALAIQLKLYPIVLLSAVYFHFVGADSPVTVSELFWPRSETAKSLGICNRFRCLISARGILYILLALTSFLLTQCLFYYLYGAQFLQESLFHHFSRQDIRHNFSVYFYPLYLAEASQFVSKAISLGAFLPQLASIILFSIRYSSDLPFGSFLILMAFVTFNKVCTSQYFVWYISILPVVAPSLNLTGRQWMILVVEWFASQGLWLLTAYLFEFRGWRTLECIWIASVVFLAVNVHCLLAFIRSYHSPVEAKTKRE